MEKIILASQSPRRIKLLKELGIDFKVIPSDIDENIAIKDPGKLVIELSKKKALDVAKNLAYDAVVIGADTIVYVDGDVLGKPKDIKMAFYMLKKLQGRIHQVYTGITVVQVSTLKTVSDFIMTEVKIKEMSDDEIAQYIKSGEVFDKAGSYAIQGKGGLIVEEINGCYYNVVGLPLNKLYEMLKGFDIDLLENK